MQRLYRCLFLSVVAVAAIGTLSLSPSGINAEETNAVPTSRNESLVGTWRLARSAIASSNAGAAAGINTRLKIYSDTHWCLVQPDPDSGRIVFVHGGTYKFDGTHLQETVDFAGEDTTGLIGQTFKFRVVFGEGEFEQIDPDGVFNEMWKRTKPKES